MQIFVFIYPAITYIPGPGGLYRKNMRKNMKFWPLNLCYKKSDQKT